MTNFAVITESADGLALMSATLFLQTKYKLASGPLWVYTSGPRDS